MSLRKTTPGLAALILTAGLFGPSPSHAYKMMHNTSSTAGWNVACDYQNGFGHWNQQTVYWYYNPAGQGAGKGFAIIDALETWTDATQSDHVLQYSGTTSAGLNLNDNQNTIVWEDTSGLCNSNACHAITVVRYSSQQLFYETDIVLNELMDWRTDGQSDACTSTAAGTKVDTQAVVTHELGHTLGLGHSTDSSATMGGSSCSVAGRSPNSDDLAGLQCATNRYPVSPAYEGFLDGYAGFNCSQISGWAWNADWPNESVYVNILDGSTLQAVVHANFYRADLFSAGKGNGIHGFVTGVPQAFKNGQWHTVRARFSGTGGELTLSPRNLICNAPLFPDPMRASQYPSTGGTVYTVGTQFSSTHSGKIVELGYLWPMSETGSHTIQLWTDTGTALTSPITITAPTLPPRWKWVTLPTPVNITAGVKYRVSINTNNYQSKSPCGTTNSLDTPYTNGPLTAHQGVWKTGTGFPDTGSCSNFFVNVKFSL